VLFGRRSSRVTRDARTRERPMSAAWPLKRLVSDRWPRLLVREGKLLRTLARGGAGRGLSRPQEQAAGPEMKVNLGCGRIVRSGFVNVDRYPHEGVDVVHDLDQVPWPFADESVDYIWASHVLEHVASLERTIREVHRSCALAVCSRSGCRTASSPSSIRSTYAHSTEPRLTCSPRWTWATSLRRGSASTRGSCGDCRWSGT